MLYSRLFEKYNLPTDDFRSIVDAERLIRRRTDMVMLNSSTWFFNEFVFTQTHFDFVFVNQDQQLWNVLFNRTNDWTSPDLYLMLC